MVFLLTKNQNLKRFQKNKMGKFENALIKGAFNPFHYGHLSLLKTAKHFSKITDIYIGNKKRPHRLPRQLRTSAVEEIIQNLEWNQYFNIIDSGTYKDLTLKKYDLYITGSDLPNVVTKTISSRGKPIPTEFKNVYSSIPNILIITRREMPLTQEAKTILEKQSKIITVSETSTASGKKIRTAYRRGNDISTLVTKETWDIIKDYVTVFKN